MSDYISQTITVRHQQSVSDDVEGGGGVSGLAMGRPATHLMQRAVLLEQLFDLVFRRPHRQIPNEQDHTADTGACAGVEIFQAFGNGCAARAKDPGGGGGQPQLTPPPKGCSGMGGFGTRPWWLAQWNGGRYPLQGAQPMPSHCLPDGRCQLPWHWGRFRTAPVIMVFTPVTALKTCHL